MTGSAHVLALGRAARRAGEHFVPAASTGPVPQRVAAPPVVPRAPCRAAPWIAEVLVICATVPAAPATGAVGIHHEVAQGEAGH
ncbi:hypothetical protein ACWCPK_28135 [Streptomyces sp. NPDC001953]